MRVRPINIAEAHIHPLQTDGWFTVYRLRIEDAIINHARAEGIDIP